MKCAKFECVFWIIYRYFIILTYRVQLKTNLYCPPHKKKKKKKIDHNSFKNSFTFTVLLYFNSESYNERS